MIVAYHPYLVLTSEGPRGGPLVVDTRRGIVLPPAEVKRAARHILAEDLILFPGLINAHDHLELNHFPRSKFREVYTNARAWAADMSVRLDDAPFAGLRAWPLRDRCWSGGLKNLLSGVTTVVQHNLLHRPLRARRFPVQVWRRYTWAHSLYLSAPEAIQRASQSKSPFFIHLAEGTDPTAEAEYNQLAALGAATARTILIHGVGLRGDTLREAGLTCAGLVWCPSSNVYLLGTTADVRPWAEARKLMLGSDSRLTADGDLLDELRAASATEQIGPRDLFEAVTSTPAGVLSAPQLGDLRPGCRADVLALKVKPDIDPYTVLCASGRADVGWVMRSGCIVWEQSESRANCTLDGVPYHLAPHLWRIARKLRNGIPGLEFRARA